jgi:hypothetical protein
MDEALPKAEQYILRSGRERELKEVCYRLLSLIKRLSRQRLRHAELPAGLLSDLEQITHQLGTSTPQEASAYLNQLLSRVSPQTRQIIHWRAAGHSFRQIAKELRCDGPRHTVRRILYFALLQAPKRTNSLPSRKARGRWRPLPRICQTVHFATWSECHRDWELEDHTTELLMTDFYAHLSNRESKSKALRNAQLDLLAKHVPPYYWATFELAGEPNGSIFDTQNKDTLPHESHRASTLATLR